MADWWNGMVSFQQVMFIIACATTLFLMVQIILMLVGAGDNDVSFDSGADFDLDVDSINDHVGGGLFGLKLISVRGVIAFFAIGSWVTYALFYAIAYWAILPGVIAGLVALVATALFIKALEKMQSDGSLNIANAVGKVGEVYLTVPARRGGSGKVNVFVQERLAEIEAVTDCEEKIKTGAKVKVIEKIDDGTLLVEPY